MEEEEESKQVEKFNDSIKLGIQADVEGHVRSCKIVGKSKFVIKESVLRKEIYNPKQKNTFTKKYVNWEIFDIVSG